MSVETERYTKLLILTVCTHRAVKMLEVTQRHQTEVAKALFSRRANLDPLQPGMPVAYARVGLSACLPASLLSPSPLLVLPAPREMLPHFTLTLTLSLSRQVPQYRASNDLLSSDSCRTFASTSKASIFVTAHASSHFSRPQCHTQPFSKRYFSTS